MKTLDTDLTTNRSLLIGYLFSRVFWCFVFNFLKSRRLRTPSYFSPCTHDLNKKGADTPDTIEILAQLCLCPETGGHVI